MNQRSIKVSITLSQGNFNSSGNTKVIEHLPVSVRVNKPMLPAKHEANISITGIQQDDLEQLTTLTPEYKLVPDNRVLVEVEGSTVFSGTITSALADYSSAPNIRLNVNALTGYYDATIAKPVYTYKGEYQIAQIFQQLAGDMKKQLINRDVSGTVRDLALSGDPWSKAVKLAKQLGIGLFMDGEEMIITAKGKVRDDQIPLWNTTSGMIGYPTFTGKGIKARHLFDQRVKLGSYIQIDSVVPKASGQWRVTRVTHNIESNIPNGKWETEVECELF